MCKTCTRPSEQFVLIASARQDDVHEWIEGSTGRTVVLLGAGASQPFVPMSRALTPLVIEYLDETYTADLPSHQLWRAISPEARLLGDDIEYLYQAVETLGYQESDPTRHWIEGFRRLGPYDESEVGRREFARDARFITSTIASAAYGIIRERSASASTDHFSSLLRAGVAGIVTLNYDTILETSARVHGIPLSTGAEQWDAGSRWSFPAGHLPLLKLHGSVNWRASRVVTPTWQIPRVGLYEVDDPAAAAPNGRIDANLVFGGGNKLRPDGPWPALFAAFEDILAAADVLVVVGYSFRDPHVDLAMRRWVAGGGERKLIVIDPYPNDSAPMQSSFGSFRYALDPDYVAADGTEGLLRGRDGRRMALVREGVTSGLPQVFGD